MSEILLIQSPTYGEQFALVDEIDYARVSKLAWRYWVNKDEHPSVQCHQECKNNASMTLGRFVMGITDPNLVVTHKNGDACDCRRENLEVLAVEEWRSRKAFWKRWE